MTLYICMDIIRAMKPIAFLGDSLKRIRDFPEEARNEAGHQLNLVQHGGIPSDFKPMPTLGPGACEIRIWSPDGTYRVFYVATRPEAVYVLHAFQKKTQGTSKQDIDLAKQRYKTLGGQNR